MATKAIKKQDGTVEVPLEEDPKEPDNTQVELDADGNPIEKTPDPKKDEPQYVTLEEYQKLQKQLNGLSYSLRNVDKNGKKMDQIISRIESGQMFPQPPVQQNGQQLDPLDQELENDWQSAVEKVAERRFRKLQEEQARQSKTSEIQQQREQTLRESQDRVRSKHPEVEDANSEKAEIFNKVLNDNPGYLSDPYGPLLAMRDMEDELRLQGKVDDATGKLIQKEAERRVRTSGHIPPGAGGGHENTIVLTKEDKEFCDQNDIKYEDYAKNRNAMQRFKGVTVNG